MIAIFCVLGVLGDAVSQAAQSFMPGVLGRPAAARRVAASLMTLGAAVGVFNCAAAAAAALLCHAAFTSNTAVVAGMQDLVPVMCASLLLHNASMATEGMLLAGRDLAFLLRANATGAALAMGAAALAQRAGAGLPGVWLAILVFQIARLGQNGARLLSAASPLRWTTLPKSSDD
jgi:Na+-driven multidrug efflux pump